MNHELSRHGASQMGLARPYYTSGSKRNGKPRKRNSMETLAGSKLARVGKGLGVVLIAAVITTGLMLAVSSQTFGLGVMAQGGILLATGIAIAAAGIVWDFPVVGIALGVGSATVAMNYFALSLGARAAGSDLVNRVAALTGSTPAQSATAATSATAPAASAATNPGGWVTSTPAWPQGLPRSTRMGDFNNITSAPYSAASYG